MAHKWSTKFPRGIYPMPGMSKLVLGFKRSNGERVEICVTLKNEDADRIFAQIVEAQVTLGKGE